VTSFPILTTQDNRQKIHLNIPEMYATVALIDPGYLTSFQDSTMIDPALNTICRAVEAMITVGSTPLTRAIAKESLSGMSHVLMDLLEDSLSDASLLPYNSVIAGIAVSQTGVSGLTGLSYSLAAHRRIPRGRAAGLLMIPYLRFVMQSKPALVDEIVEAMALRNLDDLKKGIDVLLGKKLAFTENEINLWADEACALHDISSNGIVIPTREEYLSILQNV
jgi:alcohol dehydrogenase class IV